MLAKEVLVKASDGVAVPLSIVYPKTAKLDGSNPTELYGFGSYGSTDDPFYVPRVLAWYELGGIRATCYVRGRGAYGEEWHLAGTSIRWYFPMALFRDHADWASEDPDRHYGALCSSAQRHSTCCAVEEPARPLLDRGFWLEPVHSGVVSKSE